MAKKMVLVDPRMLPARPPVPEVVPDVLRRLDGSMESIMRNSSLPVSEKLTRYNDVLSDYLNMARDYRGEVGSISTPPPTPSVSGSAPSAASGEVAESVYLDMIPRSYRGKASRLLKFLDRLPDVRWTNRGELELAGRVYGRSHIVDLLNRSVRPFSQKGVRGRPAGWEVFSRVLSDSNVPQDLLSASVRRELAEPVSSVTRSKLGFGSALSSPSSKFDGSDDGLEDGVSRGMRLRSGGISKRRKQQRKTKVLGGRTGGVIWTPLIKKRGH